MKKKLMVWLVCLALVMLPVPAAYASDFDYSLAALRRRPEKSSLR